ncbi:MAG: tetratricopeptide repeat protein [Gammaproteobacteria bacterium]
MKPPTVKILARLIPVLSALTLNSVTLTAHSAAAQSAAAHSDDSAGLAAAYPGESLGQVSFAVSCAPSVRAEFSRGVALLHDFWYEEARPQFEKIAKADPGCAMAHWGIAMSVFHQIWDRPDEHTMALGWTQLKAAQADPAKTAREREYVAALGGFFKPDKRAYQARIEGYAAAMAKLYSRYPHDVDAGTFYALSLLAAEAPDDTSLSAPRRAMAVLTPLFAKYPDHPGVVHYIIHACDTPSLAPQGLAAAKHYGEIAPSGPHAVHMPGHIFARLGMWQADIDSNAASVAASSAAELHHEHGAMDQFHSDDFLLYAYLQIAQDAKAKAVISHSADALAHFESMPEMGDRYMVGMFPYYRTKLPMFFALEMRDWQAAAVLKTAPGARPQTQAMTYWARTLAAGHLRQPQQAAASLGEYDSLMQQVRLGKHAYVADSTATRIERGEMLAWVAFAQGDSAQALSHMRESADLQDKVGQGEVDIPAREMLADILLELGQPQQALDEYERSLKLSPNRFNGLFHAGMAAEASGNKALAKDYYTGLLKATDNGSGSARPEFEHMKTFLAAAPIAAN